jgi:hypothetical protein
MPYIKRGIDRRILAVSNEPLEPPCEELGADAPELREFLHSLGEQSDAFQTSDLKLIRAIEDVIDVLITKNLICITDLPLAVQNKLMERRSLRHSLNALKLFGEDEEGTI